MAALTREENEAIAQVGEVVDMAKEHGSKQPQLREMAAAFFLGVSDSEKGRRTLMKHGATAILLRWTGDMDSVAVNSLAALVNLSADQLEGTAAAMMKAGAVPRVFETLTGDEASPSRIDGALMLLSNLTTTKEGAKEAMQTSLGDPVLVGARMRRVVERFLASPAPTGASGDALDAWQHTASVLCNVSQIQDGRDLLRRRSTKVLPRLVHELASPNPVRRRGVAAAMRNCCYETQDHDWLLSEVNILAHLLLPLAGPEEFLAEERDGMEEMVLVALDAEGASKVREPDEETRAAIFSALHLLACTKTSRQYMRRKRAYPVIRNADLAETSEQSKEVVMNIVQFLIRSEKATLCRSFMLPSSIPVELLTCLCVLVLRQG